MSRYDVLEEVYKERDYQQTKFGDAFDDKNTVNDWAAWINNYLSRATAMNAGANFVAQREALVKAAALAVAAVEAMDRNKGFPARHFGG